MQLTYGELEDFLGEIHRVAPDKRVALKGRLKHFQRLSWPAGTNKGKGARVQYGVGQTLSLAMGMELLQLGLTPERVVEQLKFANMMLSTGFLAALEDYTNAGLDPIFYIFAPESLQSLREEGSRPSSDGSGTLMVSKSSLAEMFEVGLHPLNVRRFAFVNMSDVLYEYVTYFIGRGLGAPERLLEPLRDWQTIAQEATDKHNAQMIALLDAQVGLEDGD